MRFPTFFLKYVIGFYILVTILLFVLAMTDFVIGAVTKKYTTDKHAVSFSRRVVTCVAWPVLIFTKKGRIMICNLWRNILL